MTFRLKTLRRSSQLPKQAILKNTSRQIFEKSPEAKENAASRSRLNSIDFLRGLVMVVMALDHTRHFFAAGGFNPRDVTEPALVMDEPKLNVTAAGWLHCSDGMSALLPKADIG
jgi:uncharacterized membrane protein